MSQRRDYGSNATNFIYFSVLKLISDCFIYKLWKLSFVVVSRLVISSETSGVRLMTVNSLWDEINAAHDTLRKFRFSTLRQNKSIKDTLQSRVYVIFPHDQPSLFRAKSKIARTCPPKLVVKMFR